MLNLVIGNKMYSSWSLRPWLLMKACSIPFTETMIPLYYEGSKQKILEKSPSGKVPALIDGDNVIWESLAIMEYLADRFPEAGIWPEDMMARAHARSVACEMHGGFQGLRTHCSMNLGKRFATRDRGEAVSGDVARVEKIFHESRTKYGAGGPFLYGAFSAADAMFAPLVTRLHTYSILVSETMQQYINTILQMPEFLEWKQAALTEEWILELSEVDEPAIEDLRAGK